METKNRFYLGVEQPEDIYPNYAYDISDGEILTEQESISITYPIQVHGFNKVSMIGARLQHSKVTVLKWGVLNQQYIYKGYEVLSTATSDTLNFSYDIPNGIEQIAFMFDDTTIEDYVIRNKKMEIEVFPFYKQLKKRYKKENNQMFFRESLDGKISLRGIDYEYVNSTNLETISLFTIYRDGTVYAASSFNKSDCKFDHFKKSVELKLTYNDKYSKILEAYENTYDLIKLAPALSPITVTKRSVVQIYIQGENVVSNFSGGTYWETEVDEEIDDEDKLLRKYYFSKGPKYVEVSLQGFNYNINAAYRGLPDKNIWNAVSVRTVGGTKYRIPCSIVFNKLYSANQDYDYSSGTVHLLSSGGGIGIRNDGTAEYQVWRYIYDTYRIEIYTGLDGTGRKIYQSDCLYGKDGDFTLTTGNDLYPMSKISQPSPYMEPTPATFNLGDFVIEYQIWGRLLCDVDSFESEGQTIQTYDLPNDDFATPRRNYRKCIGLSGFDSPNSVVKIYQTQDTSEAPTSYGMNDFGEYFITPYTPWRQYFYPLARSTWANTSMWVMLDETTAPYGGFEHWNKVYYKEYTLKNSYHIGDVIKALLSKIDPSIKHEKTSEYSQFLYGLSGATASALGNCDLYITQKTNILKGEYDQAAQKADIKFKQVMNMLRDCFRCYWFIDDQNRFRIEHVSYFMNGMSYYSPVIQFDLTTKKDKFNKKPALYCQRELEFDKTDLTSRYEFAWMDDVTDAMGNLTVDINNNYIQKDKTDEITIDEFTSDIDYMLFLPDDFSDDGFALLLADRTTKKVPIIHQSLISEQQFHRSYDVYVQNWYASFNQLIWHYMEDMPGYNIDYNNLQSLYVGSIKRCLKQDIDFPSKGMIIDVYKMITTDEGDGYVEDVTTNIDTDLAEIELRYLPR